MNLITWSDGMGARKRSPFLLFIRGEEIIPFKGENIKGVVVVQGTDYTKNGKWSHTTYRLQVADGIRCLKGMTGWETGGFKEGLGQAAGCNTPDTWTQAAVALGVSVPSAMNFLRICHPQTAAWFDQVDADLVNLEEQAPQETDAEIVSVCFGNPRLREIAAGFWDAPKSIPKFGGEIRKIDLAGSWVEGNIVVVGITGKVISATHSAGGHGGYCYISVAVVPGTVTELPPIQIAPGVKVVDEASSSPITKNSPFSVLNNALICNGE